ncbi:MAG: DUF1016 family protein [Candidatus Delongbacteria bacterium]|nr:DUF1016 family protein [Candidatus Delongbacteria bacterium]
MKVKKCDNNFVADIKDILEQARNGAYRAINSAMVQAYWLIGKRIVEEEQKGKERAEYGKQIIKTLSKELTEEFGKGFSSRSIWEYRQFYSTFPDIENMRTVFAQSGSTIMRTVFAQLNWSQIRLIMRLSNSEVRNYYIKETVENSWSVRTLDRNIATQYYERLLLSHSNESVSNEMKENTQKYQLDKKEFIKSPTVLEFLNIPSNIGYTENELEKAIISNIRQFLLELGKGYAFVERQQLIRTDTRDYFIDLVFYNYILNCFVLIDLKTNRITHQDVGQMDMYVRMYDEEKIKKGDNPTIGIVLCSETDQDIAKYSILRGNEQIFASKYKLYLPTEEELKAEIEREKLNFCLQMKEK